MNTFWKKKLAILTMAVMALSVFGNVVTNGGNKNEAFAFNNKKIIVCHVNNGNGSSRTIEISENARGGLLKGNPNSYLGACDVEVDDAVKPQLHCVYPEANGTYTAYFGYKNENEETVTIPHGSNNKLTKGFSTINGPQPTQFDPGTSAGYPNSSFSVNFERYQLVNREIEGPDGNDRDATASKSSPKCPVTCGDGRVNQGEQCDDGNTKNGDTCQADCTLPECGDGIVDAGEGCDDGNTKNGDTCQSDCSLPECGDGIIDQGEACDNGQENNNETPDACRTTCVAAYCGDGVKDAGEACDNGKNNNDGLADACRTTCKLPVCGDGVKDTNEACDDGNQENADACRNTCIVPVCGDNIIDSNETCDDGNTANGDGCSASCTEEPRAATVVAYKVVCDEEKYLPNMNGGADITATTAQDFVTAANIKAGKEVCRLAQGRSFQRGNESAGNGGDATYGEAAGQGRTTFGTTDASGMTSTQVPVAGLSKIQMREVNQNGYIAFDSQSNGNGTAEFFCASDVAGYDNREWITNPQAGATYYCVGFNALKEKTPVCGDGFIDINETCDDGNKLNTDDCLNTCVAASCGDGYVNEGKEACDGGEDCTDTCTIKKDSATVVFQKIVCENEAELPNRSGQDKTIDANTAAQYVADHPGCKLVDGRQFQWRTKAGSSDAGDETIGEVEGWNTTTATVGGQTSASIEIEETTNFAFREVLKEGYIPFDSANGFGAEFYCNTDVLNYDNLEYIDGMEKDATYHCVAFNAPTPKPSAKVVLHKIVCDDEKYLPNRGKNGAPDITEDTAEDFVKDNSTHCWFENDRTFQYAPIESNPGDNMLDPAGAPWTTIPATDENGMTMVSLPVDEINEYAFREVLKEDYVPFSYAEDTSDGIKKSAELYCHKDGIHYDNRDYVQGMHKNETYHCVALNALEKKPEGQLHITKLECPVQIDVMAYPTNAKIKTSSTPRNLEYRFSLGCTLADGYEFGYTTPENETIEKLPATQNGETSTVLPEGPYNVGELDQNGGWMSDENMLHMECYTYTERAPSLIGNIISSIDSFIPAPQMNPQYVYINDSNPTYCLAINPKTPSGDSSSSTSSDGKTTSVNRVIPKKKDTPKDDSSSSDDGRDETPKKPKLPRLLETGGGEESALDIFNPDMLNLIPGGNAQLPKELAATGGSVFEHAKHVFANLIQLIAGK